MEQDIDIDENEFSRKKIKTELVEDVGKNGGNEPTRVKIPIDGIFRRDEGQNDSIMEYDDQESAEAVSVTNLEKDPTRVWVVLENWGQRLDNSPCYCKECKILFATRNSLDSHKMAAHSFLVAMETSDADDSDGPDDGICDRNINPSANIKKCNHCDLTFTDNDLFIQHIYDVLLAKKKVNVGEKSKPKDKKEETDTNESKSNSAVFKCTGCKNTFINRFSAKVHNRKLHRGTASIQYIGPDHLKSKSSTAQYKLRLPKNVIFKCKNCPLHLLSCRAATTHNLTDVCGKSPTWKCYVCKRLFRLVDKNYHLLQHKEGAKIRAYSNLENVISRVLCKCTKCNVYFEESTLSKHIRDGCNGWTSSKACSICHIKLYNYQRHASNHSKRNYSKSDFILINEFISPPEDIEQTKEDKVAETVKNGTTVALYYCKKCATCIPPSVKFRETLKVGYEHVGECTKGSEVNCGICGLRFASSDFLLQHETQHEIGENLEYVFFNISDFTPIEPTLPWFDACDCGVRVVNLGTHRCVDTAVNCPRCEMRFSEQAYSLHCAHHKYLDSFSLHNNLVATILESESVKTWHILYNCAACSILTNSYDRAIDHSQRHLNNAIDKDMRSCGTCNLKFDESSFQDHNDLHKKGTMKRERLKIINYNYKDLASYDWFKLFADLTDVEVRKITCESIYASRLIRMQIMLPGPGCRTLYKCEACRRYVSGDKVGEHSRNCQGTGHALACEKCRMPFASPRLRAAHMTQCNFSHRIVSFHPERDRAFNSRIDTAPVSVSSAKFQVYQCSKCSSCSMNNLFAIKHMCIVGKDFRECELCHYVTTPRYMRTHMQWHDENKDVTTDDITYMPFDISRSSEATDGSDDSDTKESPRKSTNHPKHKFYRCQKCKHCSGSMFSISKHSCVSENKLIRCNKCDFTCSEDLMYSHHNWHKLFKNITKKEIAFVDVCYDAEDRPKNVKSKDVTDSESQSGDDVDNDSESSRKISYWQKSAEYTNCVYRCKCGLHYIRAYSFAKNQGNCCNRNYKKRKCNICGLTFTGKIVYKHIKIHHDIMKLGANDIIVKTQLSASDSDTLHTGSYRVVVKQKGNKPPANNNCLYECAKCAVHYFNLAGVKRHIALKHQSSRQKINCDVCRLNFYQNTYTKHVKIHHHSKMSMKNVFIYSVTEKNSESPPNENSDNEEDFDTTDDFNTDVCSEDNTSMDLADTEKSSELVKNTKNPNLQELLALMDSVLYRCVKCDIVYLSLLAVSRHIDNKHRICHSFLKCRDCGYKFTTLTMQYHVKIHHGDKKYTAKDYTIRDISKSAFSEEVSNTLYKCIVCGAHFLTGLNLCDHMKKSDHNSKSYVNCADCGLRFTTISIQKHVKIHHTMKSMTRADFKIDTSLVFPDDFDTTLVKFDEYMKDANESATSQSETVPESEKLTDKQPKTLESQNKAVKCYINKKLSLTRDSIKPSDSPNKSSANKADIKLYKCSECNVHFIYKEVCYKHVKTHTPLDHKEYIECKLCGLQFKVLTFAKHVRLHHKQAKFELDKVLVEEYQPTQGEPKVETYYAIEKEQSRLVTTTTEDVKSPENDKIETHTTKENENISTSSKQKDADNNSNIETNKLASNKDISGPSNDFNLDKVKKEVDTEEIKIPELIPIKAIKIESKELYNCRFCSEKFDSKTAVDFHESLDHLDSVQECMLCRKSFNKSILNDLHLGIKNGEFTCCVCSLKINLDDMKTHSQYHNNDEV